jgi:hypothetical protein
MLDTVTHAGSWRRWFAICGVCMFACAEAARAQSDALAGEDAVSEGEVAEPEAQSVAPAKARDKETLQAVLQAGAGVTERTIELPTAQGRMTLNTGLAPALNLRLSARIRNEQRFLRVRVGYQTSSGIAAGDRLRVLTAGPATTPVRSHRFEAGIVPGMWLGNGPSSPALGLFIGYGVRAFGSVAELLVPRFSLHGPMLRLELELPLSPLWSLRVAPEGHLIISMTEDLRRAGALDKIGMAYGGEASLQVRVFSRASLRASYRESHAYARAGTAANAHFVDVERYLVVDAVFRY